MSSLQITRCVCYDKTFVELKKVAEEHGCASVEALQRHVEFGLNCKLCHPYVRRMLKTGETVFGEIIEGK
jgi:bacterioferritin-associated ferredoxin